ncbi:anhydro-N-acetylmuramic acid kinase [Pasteurellaceae bacterium Pebbles2]|nr:anhydro-N-acetylmuramic acid kinase [Pasteurellaceae bacterium Pebbles2]
MIEQTKKHLRDLQKIMQELALWQTVPPAEQAFLSTEPFAIDVMSVNEWLQWIFIPRMWALLESGAQLPRQIAISPYVEEALKEQERLAELLQPIIKIEELLQAQC